MDLLKLYTRMKVNGFINKAWPFIPKIMACITLVVLMWQKDINLNLNLSNESVPTVQAVPAKTLFAVQEKTEKEAPLTVKDNYHPPEIIHQSAILGNVSTQKTILNYKEPSGQKNNLANTYSNMTYDTGKKTAPAAVSSKRKKQEAYINRFVKVAQSEMKKFGIPASITLAQGLIESNAGESRLSTKNNNHFGMKCFSKKCGKGHCSNFTDDSHKDFFRKYATVWESYRAHSQLLKSKRYRPLFKLKKNDYKGWAHGLKKAGYATDRHYAKKLIHLIESLNLQQYDRL